MYLFIVFNPASQDVLEYVGQEAGLKTVGKAIVLNSRMGSYLLNKSDIFYSGRNHL